MKKTYIIKIITILSVMVAVAAIVLPIGAHAEENRTHEMFITLKGVVDSPCTILTYSHGIYDIDDRTITIKKRIDKNTPRIVQAYSGGETIPSGELKVVYSDGCSYREVFTDAVIVQDIINLEYVDDYQEPVENIVIRVGRSRIIVD